MIRSESFDCLLAKERLKIARILFDKEFQLGEIRGLANIKNRQNAYHHLNILIAAGLVEKKLGVRKSWNPHAKNKHSQVFRYTLSDSGKRAVEYFSVGGLSG